MRYPPIDSGVRSTASSPAMARIARREPPVFEPHFVMREHRPTESLYAGDAGYADSDPDLPGTRHRMVMAPGKWQYLNEGVVPW